MKTYRKLTDMLKHQLGRGSHPRALSTGVALGVVLGLFPVPGVTTVLCGLAALALRLNHVVLQAANYAVYPLQVAMLGVYIGIGNLWLGTGTTVADLTRAAALIGEDLVAGGLFLTHLILPGVAAWFLTAPLLGAGIYALTRPAFARWQTMTKPAASPGKGIGP